MEHENTYKIKLKNSELMQIASLLELKQFEYKKNAKEYNDPRYLKDVKQLHNLEQRILRQAAEQDHEYELYLDELARSAV